MTKIFTRYWVYPEGSRGSAEMRRANSWIKAQWYRLTLWLGETHKMAHPMDGARRIIVEPKRYLSTLSTVYGGGINKGKTVKQANDRTFVFYWWGD